MSTDCNLAYFHDSEEERHISCTTCQDLPFRNRTWSPFYIPNFEDEGRIWYTKVSYESLHHSSQKECAYCDFLFQFAKTMVENIRPAMPELVTFRFGWWWDGSSNLSVKMNYEGLTVDELFHLYITKGTESSWPNIQIERHLSLDRVSTECVSVMKSWLSTCLESHPQCRSAASLTLPDRVLEISRSLDVRLIENFGGETTGRFIALSHCWGGTVAMQLNSESINDFKQSISFGHLPKTFQDAVAVCYALDIQYLWIDSLCIMQDSPEDWALQGSKMAQIYSDCLVTIAADAAANSKAGFLQRVPDPVESSVICHRYDKTHTHGYSQEYKVHMRKNVDVSYLGSFPHHYAAAPDTSKNQELGSHLSKRGWCFQESLLPIRVLHFAIDHLSWSCRTDAFCECMYGSMDPDTKRYRSLLSDGFEEGRIIDRETMKEDWQNIVEEYTRRHLTYSSDRLAALAGLAAHVRATHPNIEYLAGLWSDTLPQSLLWHPHPGSERAQPYIAPSWSWASVTRSVRWGISESFEVVDQTKLKLITVNCSPAGPNKYGALKSAELLVQGQLWRVKLLEVDTSGFASTRILQENGTNSPYVVPIGGTWDVAGEVMALHEQGGSSGDTSSSESSSCPDESESEEDGSADEEESSSQEESSYDDSSSDSDSQPEADGEFALLNVLGFVWFLVLRRCEQDDRSDTFQRVGITSASEYDATKRGYTSLMSLEAQALGVTRKMTLV